jgi:uncharacterized membrane protein YheB (UPF0754 family)
MKNLLTFTELSEGALPRESSVKQLEELRRKTKKVTIDDKISDMNKQGANIQYIHNPVDTGIESYEDYQRNAKPQKLTTSNSK